MKYYILLFYIAVSSLSCSSIDEQDKEMTKELSLSQLMNVVDLSGLKSNSKAVFRNEKGEEKILNINYSETKVEYKFENFVYTTPKISINLFDISNVQYTLYIYLMANIIDGSGTQRSFLNAGIFSNFVDYTPSISFDQDAKPSICISRPEITLNNRTFEKVYSSIPVTDLTKFTELHYSSKVGIIGFKDYKNELWVFERFEK